MKRVKKAFCFLLVNSVLVHAYAQVQKPAQPAQPVPVTQPDSITKAMQRQLQVEKARLTAPIKQLAIPNIKSTTAPLLNIAKAPLQDITGKIKLFEGAKSVKLNSFNTSAEYSYFRDTSGMGLGAFNNIQGAVGYNISGTLALGSMPFNISMLENNGINTLNYTPFQNFYKFNFDQQAYLQSLRNEVMQKISPEAIMNSALSRVANIRRGYEQELQGEINQLQNEFTKEYKTAITLPSNATNLSAKDMSALRTQLLPGDIQQKYLADVAAVQALSRAKDPKALLADTNYIRKMGNIKQFETLEKIYSKITTWQQRYQNNPLVKMLLSQSKFNPDNLKAFLSDPNNISKVIDDQASLSAIQRLFVNIKTLNTGQNSAQSGDMALQNVMNNGINAEYQNKSTSFGMIYGKNNMSNNWLQAGLTSQVTSQFSNLTGFKFGTGSGSPVDQSIAFNFFSMSNSPGIPATPIASSGIMGGPGAATQYTSLPANYLSLPPHQDGVITLHTGYKFGETGSISLDLSKSFGSFKQNATGDSSFNKSIPGGSVFNNAGKANYAGALSFIGNFFKTDVKIFVKKVGLGYNNPGNPLLRTGESQAGLGLARKFLNNRLSLRYDGDYRSQTFDPNNNYTYSAINNKLTAGFKIDRNDRISLTYQRSDYRTAFYGQSPSLGTNELLQFNAGYRFIINKKKVLNNFTISRQQMNLPLTIGGSYSNSTLLVTNTSSMMLGKNMVSMTLTTNQANNNSYYFNSSMSSAEVNYSYPMAGGFRLSSGLGYYANYGWNQQVGIRQQVGGTIGNRLALDLQVAYKKAVQIIRPELADQLYIGTTMHYTFK